MSLTPMNQPQLVTVGMQLLSIVSAIFLGVEAVLAVLITSLTLTLIIIDRSNKVHAYRSKLADFVFMTVNVTHTDTLQRIRWFESLAKHNDMVFQFWKPFDSFIVGQYREAFFQWRDQLSSTSGTE